MCPGLKMHGNNVLQSSATANHLGVSNSRRFCFRDHQGDGGYFDLQCLCDLIFLFDLGKSTCVLNFSIQL